MTVSPVGDEGAFAREAMAPRPSPIAPNARKLASGPSLSGAHRGRVLPRVNVSPALGAGSPNVPPVVGPVVELVETKVAPTPAVVSGSIAGLRVAITRSADRAGALADDLAAAGAEPVLVPLIDFEIAERSTLGAALARLAAGEYRWLVISSITTVRALKHWCEAEGTTLAELIPATTSVATIGPTSVAVLAAEGIEVQLAPVDVQSAAGLVALWPAAAGHSHKVLLPQSDLAEATLLDGIHALGWDAEVVTAYRTVDYPAAPAQRLTAVLAMSGGGGENGGYRLLTPAQAAGELAAGLLDAVVLASGSAARRAAIALGPLPESTLVIAIGQPTKSEAERCGLRVAATATHPTPAGIVAALTAAIEEFAEKATQGEP